MTEQLTKPPEGLDDDNDFHELWWDESDRNPIPNSKLRFPLHEVWQWMGDAPSPAWAVPGESEWVTAEKAWEQGWRYVRPIKLMDQRPRGYGMPPDPVLDEVKP